MAPNPKIRLILSLLLLACLGFVVWQHMRLNRAYRDVACDGCMSEKARAKFIANNGGSSPSEQSSIHPMKADGWVETKLYFGLGSVDTPEKGTTETQWRGFLDKEVTPRFPSGLSVEDLYGQWQSRGGANISHIRSKVLIIDYPANVENEAKIEAIRAAWKQKTGAQSVLKVTQPADVSF